MNLCAGEVILSTSSTLSKYAKVHLRLVGVIVFLNNERDLRSLTDVPSCPACYKTLKIFRRLRISFTVLRISCARVQFPLHVTGKTVVYAMDVRSQNTRIASVFFFSLWPPKTK